MYSHCRHFLFLVLIDNGNPLGEYAIESSHAVYIYIVVIGFHHLIVVFGQGVIYVQRTFGVIPIDFFTSCVGSGTGFFSAAELHQEVLPLYGDFRYDGIENVVLRVSEGVVERGTKYDLLSCNEIVAAAVCCHTLCYDTHCSGIYRRFAQVIQAVAYQTYRLCLTCHLTDCRTEEHIRHSTYTLGCGRGRGGDTLGSSDAVVILMCPRPFMGNGERYTELLARGVVGAGVRTDTGWSGNDTYVGRYIESVFESEFHTRLPFITVFV